MALAPPTGTQQHLLEAGVIDISRDDGDRAKRIRLLQPDSLANRNLVAVSAFSYLDHCRRWTVLLE